MKVRYGKGYHANEGKKKAEITLISEKKTLKIVKDKKNTSQRSKINPRRGYNCKYICTQHKSSLNIQDKCYPAIKGEINGNICCKNFNTSPTPMDRSFRHKTRKMQGLNDTLDQIDLIDIL